MGIEEDFKDEIQKEFNVIIFELTAAFESMTHKLTAFTDEILICHRIFLWEYFLKAISIHG